MVWPRGFGELSPGQSGLNIYFSANQTVTQCNLHMTGIPVCASAECIRVCLHGGGGPQVGEVACGGTPRLSCKRDQIKMRDCIDKRGTSPTWGPPSPCKQASS